MTIRRGEPWGSAVERPGHLRVCGSDRALAQALMQQDGPPLGVGAGDLYRSVGAPPPRTDMQALPIDLIDVTIDDEPVIAVAHVVVRRSWWRGPILAVMNVDHIGNWNVAPRAHPNDGRLDIVEVGAEMTVRQRWQARGRLVSGTHVPHPAITTRTARDAAWSFERPHGVWLDGERVGETNRLAVVIRPDAFTLYA